MNDNGLFNPPAIVRSVKRSRGEIEEKARRAWGAYSHHGKGLVESGRELGEVLCELHDGCQQIGEWTALLARLGIPIRTAQRLVKKFKTPAGEDTRQVALTGQGLEEELSGHMRDDEPAEQPDGDSAPQSTPTGGGGAPAPSADPPKLCCRACRVAGKAAPTPKCKGCEAVNEVDRFAVEPAIKCPDCQKKWRVGCAKCLLLNMPPKGEREPGEDDGELDTDQQLGEREAAREAVRRKAAARKRMLSCPHCGLSFDPKESEK